MLIIAIDTSGALCSVTIIENGIILSELLSTNEIVDIIDRLN